VNDSLWLVVPVAQRAAGDWIDDTLAARAAEKGLTGRLDLAGRFPRRRVEVIRSADPVAQCNALYLRRGWTDGLPIVPPAIARVDDMLRFSARPREAVLGEMEPLAGLATVERVAANAVMAGCRPEYFPVVLSAVEAILAPEFNLRGVQTTDENVTPLLVVCGPIAQRLGVNGGFGALGPGWQANASIGRALRLVMHNLGGGWPAAVSLAGLGQPARYTLCLAENTAQSPWEPLHVELGLKPEDNAVVVQRAESVVNVTGGLEEIASVMGSLASAFSLLHGGRPAVLLAPYVAARLAAAGLGKAEVKRRLHQLGRIPVEQWRRSWLARELIRAERWPDWVKQAAEQGAIPAVESPEDITLVVAGGDLAIAQHAYLPSWGFPSARIVKPIELPADWAAMLAEGTRP